jgi:hypothetical protein
LASIEIQTNIWQDTRLHHRTDPTASIRFHIISFPGMLISNYYHRRRRLSMSLIKPIKYLKFVVRWIC